MAMIDSVPQEGQVSLHRFQMNITQREYTLLYTKDRFLTPLYPKSKAERNEPFFFLRPLIN